MPRTLVLLGAGNAGTIVANRMARHLPDWHVVVIDPERLPGRSPLPGVGPLTRLDESPMNH